jgi:hypothetical protein
LWCARGARGKARFRLGGRASLRVVAGCGLLVALGPPAAQARPRLEGHPKPPSQAQINAAENQVRQHQAALGAAQGKLSAASAELSRLQTQAEVLIERYDQAQVNEQRAASAYQVTEARLRQAERQQAASRPVQLRLLGPDHGGAGVQLLHYTGYQWQEGPHVPLSQLRRGDLLFYATNTSDPSTIHHVAIYIGNGMMVNAPYTGAFVRIDSM